MAEDRAARVRQIRRALEAQLASYEKATEERWSVVPSNLYLQFSDIVRMAVAEVGELLPPFDYDRFFQERAASGGVYSVAAIRAYLTTALAVLDADAQLPPDDGRYMELAIAESLKCVPEDTNPRPHVGVVVVSRGEVLATAYRGEVQPGEHAEFCALERKLATASIAGATVFTTLEPCTTRKHPKIPCARRLVERKIARVVIGMLDPDPRITGQGVRTLRDANIEIGFFGRDLASRVEELNRDFTRGIRSAPYLDRGDLSPSVPSADRVARSKTPRLRAEFPGQVGIGGVSAGGSYAPEWNLRVRLIATEKPVTILEAWLREEGVGRWRLHELTDLSGRRFDLPLAVSNAAELWMRSASPTVLVLRPRPEDFGRFFLELRDHEQPPGDHWVFQVPDSLKCGKAQ